MHCRELTKDYNHCYMPNAIFKPHFWCHLRTNAIFETLHIQNGVPTRMSGLVISSFRAVVISYTFYFMRSTFKCYTISSNQTFKSYTISISYQFNFQMLYIHTDVITFLLLNLHKLYLNMKSSFKSPKLEKRLNGFHYKNLLQLT